MSTLFEETAINGMAMPNRMIRSATWEGMCDVDGRPTGKLIDFYRVLAQGGIGLIVSGYTFVRQDGKQMPGKMGIHTDDFEPEMRKAGRSVSSWFMPAAKPILKLRAVNPLRLRLFRSINSRRYRLNFQRMTSLTLLLHLERGLVGPRDGVSMPCNFMGPMAI